jgi:hypothetical protein
MRQHNTDAMCPNRVVPACRGEGSTQASTCDPSEQYFALPSRRLASVARLFAERYNTGTLSSVCKNDYSSALQSIVDRLHRRLTGRCLSRPLDTVPPVCTRTRTTGCAMPGTPVRVNCIARETLPMGMSASSACTAARGRTPGARDTTLQRDNCIINQVAAPLGGAPAGTSQGFFYDTRPDPAALGCRRQIDYTNNALPVPGSSVVLECVQVARGPVLSTLATCMAGVGDVCNPIRPGGLNCDTTSSAGCFDGLNVYLESASRSCASGHCLVYNYAEVADRTGSDRARRVHCTCRCGVPAELAGTVSATSLCACPNGFSCREIAGLAYPPEERGSYCVRDGILRFRSLLAVHTSHGS